MKHLLFSLSIIISAFIAAAIAPLQVLGQKAGSHGMIYNDCGVPYELNTLTITRNSGYVFALAEGRFFNEKDLRTLFSCLSKKYAEFSSLSIELFSDSANLDVSIRNMFHPPPIANPPDDTSAEDCKNVRNAIRPCPYGYYRARYFKSPKWELIDYSKDPAKTTMTRVLIADHRDE